MIIVQLIGGMGNQMFQYALAKSVSDKKKMFFKMDAGYFEKQVNVTPRKYALSCFNVQENIASKEDLARLGIRERGKLIEYAGLVLKKLIGSWNKNYFLEQGFGFDERVFNVGEDAYFEGYWQTEKYFENIRDIIRKDFTLKNELSIENKKITTQIKNSNSVSLHIRRGDYVTNASANKFHGTCSLEYYTKAVKKIAEKIENPVCYIFSDDIAWAKNNLEIDFPVVYVSDGFLKDYEELTLMSYCKHNIIANSSFSWWGAWLNSNPEKIVIAPQNWFTKKTINISDVIPDTWIKL